MNDVEAIWTRSEQRTRKYWVCSLTYEEYCRPPWPAFPGWEALGL